MTEIVTLTIELLEAQPPVSRTIEVPLAISMGALHATIQAAMGWENDHLHAFEIGGREAPSRLTFAELVGSRRRSFEYRYDFGDDWLHRIRIGKKGTALDGVLYPRLIDGAGACPPEDSGGVWGYMDKLEIMNDPSDPDHEDIMDWLGGPIDPEFFDQAEAARRVEGVASRLAKRTAKASTPRKR